MSWLQLRVHTARPEFAEELLLAHGATAVSFEDAADQPVLEPAPGETPLWPQTVVSGLFAPEQKLDAVVASLRELLPEAAALRTATELIEDRDWVRVWLRDCPPVKFGERLWVTPAERAAEVPDRQAVVVKLDPGLAFGTGTHPSTALCLDWLAGNDLTGAKLVDYGCGSGILAVAALKLGAARAVCVDIDPQALSAARSNAQANEVGDRLVALTAEDFVAFPADVVLANILANPLLELAPRLASGVRCGGRIVLAGLLRAQAEEVRAAYARWFEFEPDAVKDGWVRLCGRCRMPALINDVQISPRLRTAGQPQPEHFSMLAAEGYEAVINLALRTSPNALADEAGLLQRLGLDYFQIPVAWEKPTARDFEAFCARMEQCAARKTLVHCAMNKRVSAFVFLWRVLREKIPAQDAYRDLARVWEPNPVWRAFIEGTLAAHAVKFSIEKTFAQ